MKILFIAAENAPYTQVGGLSQAVSFLARAVRKLGHDARVFTPKYGIVNTRKYRMATETQALLIPTGQKKGNKLPSELVCNVKQRISDPIFPPTYFLENKEYYEQRANVYGYGDDHVRFYLLSLGCLEWLLSQKQKGGWVPDVLHAHDWHAGYIVELIKKHPRYKKALKNIRVLYTIHNFRHQGNNDFLYATDPDNGKKPLLSMLDPHMKMQNPMLRAMLHADHVNTVSKNYALEVRTKELGEGLEKYTKRIAYKMSGITNGIDTTEMDPATDAHIVSNFNLKKFDARRPNKAVLQRHFKLPVSDSVPVVAFVGRLAGQKGVDLIFKVLEHIEALPPVQFIFLGGGDDSLISEVTRLCEQHPAQVAAIPHLDFILPRKVFAGSDILLIPSRFEPGGIVAMEGLRYGAVPIVSDTGGLSETISEFNPGLGTGNGFLHERNDMWGLFVQLISALQIYAIPDVWSTLVKNAMACDFSWDHTAIEYEKLYKLTRKPK